MKKKFRLPLSCAAAAAFAVLLTIFSGKARAAAGAGLTLCLETIIPSLFPFFVMSSLIISSGLSQAVANAAGHLMPAIFGVSGSGALPLILGFTGGYPVGAKTVAELYRSGAIDKKEAGRLLVFTSNTGPAFILGAAGAAVFKSPPAGAILYISHILSALIIGGGCRLLFGSAVTSPPKKPSPPETSGGFISAVTGSFAAVLNVCAFVVIFSVFTGLLDSLGVTSAICAALSRLGADPVKCRMIIAGFFEISSGIAALRDVSADLTFALPAASFIISWGGLSVHLQAMSFVSESGLPMGGYFIGKLCHGLLSAGLTWFFTVFSGIQPVFAFTGHETAKSFIFDYIGLFYSAACILAGLIVLLLTRLKNRRQ